MKVPSPITDWLAASPGRSVFGKFTDGKAHVVLVDTCAVAATEEGATIEEAIGKALNSLFAKQGATK